MLNEAASRMFYLWSQDVPPDKEDGDALGAILHDVSTSGRKNVLLMTSADVVAVILDKVRDQNVSISVDCLIKEYLCW